MQGKSFLTKSLSFLACRALLYLNKARAKPGFFEGFLGKTICEKVSLLDIGALEQIGLTTKSPKKTVLCEFYST